MRKEKQLSISQPDNFSKLDFTIPSQISHSESGFPTLFQVFRLLFGDPQNFINDEDKARNFNISAIRGRNRCLVAAVI